MKDYKKLRKANLIFGIFAISFVTVNFFVTESWTSNWKTLLHATFILFFGGIGIFFDKRLYK